ncbi:hypothetical protein M1293_03590 [Candidatus Parvarchaeota archaeon]|nr:hypothetical protein [Candidatus Parvarchaeota archaeon]
MKAQVFTLDLVIGTVIILSIIASVYSISSYYSSINQSVISSGSVSGTYSSAVSAFSISNITIQNIDALQVAGDTSAFQTYVVSTLGKELPVPFSINLYAKEVYSGYYLPNVSLFAYSSSGFPSTSAISVFYEPVIVTNQSSLCGSSCNVSLQAQSVFPGENSTVAAPDCTVSTNTGASTGWRIVNDSPSGFCTIEVGSYSDAKPDNYLVKAYSSSGTSEGETTMFVLSLDYLKIEIS